MDAVVCDTDGFWSAGSPTQLTVPAGVLKVRLRGDINKTFGGSGCRHAWAHKNGALFFGAAEESDFDYSGVQSTSTGLVLCNPAATSRSRVSWRALAQVNRQSTG